MCRLTQTYVYSSHIIRHMNDFQDADKIDTVLDEMNFRNMVVHYYNELLSIKNGTRAYEVLSFKERKKLKDQGIVSYDQVSAEVRLTKRL